MNARVPQCRALKYIRFFIVVNLIVLLLLNQNKMEQKELSSSAESDVFPVVQNYERKDWHDWSFINNENTRTGPGEQGAAVILTDPSEIQLSGNFSNLEGLSPVVSDKLSINRSLVDGRLPLTVHSVYNRTPHELLHEILLINDGSTKKELFEPLEGYVRENFDYRVKIVNLKVRKGLIVARMEGSRMATGKVLIFLDAHMEVNVNWLPPLLEPIAIDPLTATLPIIDDIDPDNFGITFIGHGERGVFDWEFNFRWLPRRPEDMLHPEKPAPYPVMLGDAFAIRRDYFFSLGGYDERLMIWNGENYEISFKLWLCGGKILEVPCSRVAHVFRYHNNHRLLPDFDYVTYNFKRVAEVWLEDLRHCLYATDPEKYKNIDAGDLTEAKRVKQALNCKPFQYFLENVMPDQVARYPCNPGVFTSGVIQSESQPDLCVDTLGLPEGEPVGLYACHSNRTSPGDNQHFSLTWNRQIKQNSNSLEICLDVHQTRFFNCHFQQSNQLWFYNLKTHQIMNTPDRCLKADIESKTLETATCSEIDPTQQWLWGFTNTSALINWIGFGVELQKCSDGETVSFSCQK